MEVFKHLNAFLSQCGHCVGKWKILEIADESVNCKTHILLELWSFHGKNVDEAWYLLEWIGWDLFEFEKASCISGYSFFDPCTFYSRSYYTPFWSDLYNSSDHGTNLCPYYACYAQHDFVLP